MKSLYDYDLVTSNLAETDIYKLFSHAGMDKVIPCYSVSMEFIGFSILNNADDMFPNIFLPVGKPIYVDRETKILHVIDNATV